MSYITTIDFHLAVVELDPATGPCFVGVGGIPNSDGRGGTAFSFHSFFPGDIELDAAVMRGLDCRVGAVVALRGIASPISVAAQARHYVGLLLLMTAGAAREPALHAQRRRRE